LYAGRLRAIRRTGDAHLLAVMHHEGLRSRGSFTFAAPDGDDSRVALFVDVDAIFAGALNGEGHLRCIDFDAFVLIQAAHAQAERAERHLNLRHAVIKVDEREVRAAVEPDRGRPDIEFGTRTGFGP